MNVKRYATAGLVSAGLLAASGQSPADATPITYLGSLSAHGIQVTDAVRAVRMGYAICKVLELRNGQDVAQAVYELTRPDLTRAEASTVMTVAVEELCPWHDHRSSVVGTSDVVMR